MSTITFNQIEALWDYLDSEFSISDMVGRDIFLVHWWDISLAMERAGKKSTMGERRIELVEECEHGATSSCTFTVGAWNSNIAPHFQSLPCPGGSRRVLSDPTEQMVEAAATEISALVTADAPTWQVIARAALAAAFGSTTEEDSDG
jgi:hypothetical protein